MSLINLFNISFYSFSYILFKKEQKEKKIKYLTAGSYSCVSSSSFSTGGFNWHTWLFSSKKRFSHAQVGILITKAFRYIEYKYFLKQNIEMTRRIVQRKKRKFEKNKSVTDFTTFARLHVGISPRVKLSERCRPMPVSE